MKHFAYYPKIEYATESSVNILVRGKIRDAILQKAGLYYKYYIDDRDTAEMIAEKYYGSSEYVWAIYYANSIFHPTFEWPMRELVFIKFLESKYGSVANAINTTHHYEMTETETNTTYIIDETTYRSQETAAGFPDYVRAVSSYNYELAENNKRRNIVILDKAHLLAVTNELKVLFK